MANRKISDLTALTAPATGDLLPIVDISEAAAADKNKKITFGELFASIPAGTAAAPSVAFEGDNTGIYSPGADQVAISTNGTGRLFVDASGRVNIGTTSEPRKLHVSNGYSAATSLDGSLVQLISSNGNTGDFAGLGILGGTTGGSFIHFGDTDNAGVGRLGYFHSDNSFRINTNGTEVARIDSSGRLLVGATSDSGGALLQVNGDRIRIGTAKTPASATATGTTGEIAWDANYIYVCTATNTWKRVAIATW